MHVANVITRLAHTHNIIRSTSSPGMCYKRRYANQTGSSTPYRMLSEKWVHAAGGLRVARRSMSERNATLSKLERVPMDPPPAEESVRQIVSSATACENPRHRNETVSCIAPCSDCSETFHCPSEATTHRHTAAMLFSVRGAAGWPLCQ